MLGWVLTSSTSDLDLPQILSYQTPTTFFPPFVPMFNLFGSQYFQIWDFRTILSNGWRFGIFSVMWDFFKLFIGPLWCRQKPTRSYISSHASENIDWVFFCQSIPSAWLHFCSCCVLPSMPTSFQLRRSLSIISQWCTPHNWSKTCCIIEVSADENTNGLPTTLSIAIS